MTVYEETVLKLRQLPEPLVQEVSDFVDFLLTKTDSSRGQVSTAEEESRHLAEAGMDDYLANLEDYEDRLARGEIQW